MGGNPEELVEGVFNHTHVAETEAAENAAIEQSIADKKNASATHLHDDLMQPFTKGIQRLTILTGNHIPVGTDMLTGMENALATPIDAVVTGVSNMATGNRKLKLMSVDSTFSDIDTDEFSNDERIGCSVW